MIPKSDRGVFSLWLVPPPEVRRRLAMIIEEFSRSYATPLFTPHVTLVGSVEGAAADIARRSRKLASSLAPVPMRLVRAGFRPEYYRCLFLEVQSPALTQAHAVAQAVLGVEARKAYGPHLSLVYGNLPAEVKQRLLPAIDRHLPLEFDARLLLVVRTEGEVASWRRVARFVLKVVGS